MVWFFIVFSKFRFFSFSNSFILNKQTKKKLKQIGQDLRRLPTIDSIDQLVFSKTIETIQQVSFFRFFFFSEISKTL